MPALRRLTTHPYLPWILPVLIWLTVVCWRPLVAGFYHDDWVVLRPLTSQEGFKLFIDQASRPAYAALVDLVRLTLPFDPFYYQVLLIFLVALSATAIAFLAMRIVEVIEPRNSHIPWAGALAASTWLAIPWDLGISVWPTAFAAHISITGFCILSSVVLGDDSISSKLVKSLGLFLAISLISEIFWLSFAPILIILAAGEEGFWNWRKQREPIILLLGFCVIQGFLALINRILAYFGIGINRSFNVSWTDTAWSSVTVIPFEVSRSVLFPSLFWAILILGLLGFIATIALHPKRRIVIATLAAICIGSAISITIWALAGYRIESIGVLSRTTVVISVWFSLLPAIFFSATARHGILIQRAAIGISIILVLLLAASSINNLGAWEKSWNYQKALLKSLPANKLAMARPDSFILIDADKPTGAVEGFEAFWDITGALYSRYPELRSKFAPKGYRQFAAMVNRGKFQTKWDGKTLVQSWCHAPDTLLWKLGAPSQLYLWDYRNRKLSKLNPPVKFGCEN